jgi:TRAP-type transport system periplasmic protein
MRRKMGEKMNTRSLMSMLGVAALSTTIAAAPVRAETLSYATWQAEASQDLHAISLHWLRDELSRRTNGAHSLNVFWGGTLAGIAEISDAVESGLAQMGDLVVPYFPDQLLINNAIGFFWPQPHSARELAELMWGFHHDYPQFGDELSAFNMRMLGLRPLGAYGMLCNQPVRNMSDFAGLRIRGFGVALPAAIQAIGAVPVSMSTVETYEALQRGVLDCTPIEPVIARGWRYDEVAKYYIDVPMGASWGQYIVINTDTFAGLPADLQEVLIQLGADYHVHFTNEQDRLTAQVLAEWAARDDFEIITLPPAEFLAVTEAAESVRAARQQWITRAAERGLPSDRIAEIMSFQ